MRLLIIAYEFPPSRSPQALRWAYLSRELCRLGHDVHVLTVHLGGDQASSYLLDGAFVHRTWAGPLRSLVAFYRDIRRPNSHSAEDRLVLSDRLSSRKLVHGSRRGWRLQLSQQIQKVAEYVFFPDLRGEWRRPGQWKLSRLLREIKPDVVISSHEPATTLELGLVAKTRGHLWVADLGDPVLAPYTPRHWITRARALEASVWLSADHILVTSAAAADMLSSRHGPRENCTVITQGHDSDNMSVSTCTAENKSKFLEMLYTGSFYSFRDPIALLRAVVSTPGVRLSIASVSLPEPVAQYADRHPDAIRLLGFLAHEEALQWQRNSHVLVNIANADPQQVPGKFYEYLGARRPILHLEANAPDEAGRLIKNHGWGWVTPQDETALARLIAELSSRFQEGTLDCDLRLESPERERYSWRALARQLHDVLLKTKGGLVGPAHSSR